MVTIRDVARLAGVSPITVSRVVNHHDHVSPTTRARVESAIAELAYIPNALGPSLRSKRTGMLALLVSDIMNPFWTTVARGVEDTANRHSHHIIICNTGESPAKQEEYLTFLLQKQVDGFLMVPISLPSLEQLLARKKPVVVLDRRVPQFRVDAVRGDSEGGAYELTRHLIELGHRQIAIVTGPREHSTAIDRVAGYLRALGEAGLSDEGAGPLGRLHARERNSVRARGPARAPATDRHRRGQQLPGHRHHESSAGGGRPRSPGHIRGLLRRPPPGRTDHRPVLHGRVAARLRDRPTRHGAAPPAPGG